MSRTKSFVHDHSTRILSAIHKAHKTKGSRDKQPPRSAWTAEANREIKTQSLAEELSTRAQEILQELGNETCQDLPRQSEGGLQTRQLGSENL